MIEFTMEVEYIINSELRKTKGKLVPADGPFNDFMVLELDDGSHRCIKHRAIVVVNCQVPDFFLVEAEVITRSKELQKREFEMNIKAFEADYDSRFDKGPIGGDYQ